MGHLPVSPRTDHHVVIKEARPASTICLLRDGIGGLEVLMVQRGLTARFMGGAWVFPGGVVDELDSGDLAREAVAGAPGDDLHWIGAGLRELAEEVKIWVTTETPRGLSDAWLRDRDVYLAVREAGTRFDADRAVYFANWITPTMIPVRFDTRFYAVVADEGVVADPDPRELDAAEWLTPAAALELARNGERTIPFPTQKVLEQLSGHARPGGFMDQARGLDAVPPIMPRGRIGEDGSVEVVLPGEPGYEALGDVAPQAGALSKAARAAAAKGHLAELVGDES